MNLEINRSEDRKGAILSLSGEIDAYTAPQLKESFGTLLGQEDQTIIVDMEKVTYMDSTGLGVFISALKSAKEKINN